MTSVSAVSSTDAYYYDYDASVTTSETDDTSLFYVSESGETCTDGEDDGKIGLGGVLVNCLKGAAKTAVSTIKGCFTDSDGNFSLGKTALTVASAAVCIAFPAVGLAACAVGAVSGAVTMGKGIANAMSAETDAEAKEAWQDVGGGALTTGLSIAGAKASLNAVKATSTAAGEAGSALDALDDTATIAQRAAALGKDMVSSTSNRASSIAQAVKSGATTASEVAQYKISEAKASKIDTNTALTESEVNTLNEFNARSAFLSEDAQAVVNSMDDASAALSAIKEAGVKGNIKSAATSVKSAFTTLKSNLTASNIKSAVSSLPEEGQAILQALQNTSSDAGYVQLVNEYGYESVLAVLETLAGGAAADNAV